MAMSCDGVKLWDVTLTAALVMTLILPHALYAWDSTAQDLTYTDTQQTSIDEDTLRRQHWELSDLEWTRYKHLMAGIRGSISPANISPIEVLGTHARSEHERRQYAEIWAKMRHDDAERIIAFQQAYNEAFQKLYPNQPLIDPNRLKKNRQAKTEIGDSDRILVFIKIKQCPECDSLVQRLTHHPTLRAQQLDLYFVDTQAKRDDARIRQWAKAQGIDKKRLKNGTITLNHDRGNYYQLTQQLVGPVPQVFKIKGQNVAAMPF